MKATQERAMPAAVPSNRDSDGRLVGVVLDSEQSLLPGEDNVWLVAIDGSEHSLRATAKAAHLVSLMKNGGIHLVSVQPWLSKEAAENELSCRGWEATSAARTLLDDSGIPWRLHVLMGEAAEHIVALADQLGCGVIVIGSRGLGMTQAMLLGSVAYKVVHQSNASVLLVR